MEEVTEDLRAFIGQRVRGGFDSIHEIIEDAGEHAFSRYGRDDLLPEIKRIAVEVAAAHRTEEATWDGPTDCDRLDAAFAALNDRGIVALQDFSCCNNCGFTEIWAEVDKAERRGPVEGYVFYHLQATETAVTSGRLLMAYGSIEDDETAFRRVAETIVAELGRRGLDASWKGTLYHPIAVDGLVWRRRR